MGNLMQNQQFFNVDSGGQNVAVDCETFGSLQQELAYGFGGECDDSDEDEENDPGASVLFNYKEKSFQEDDILDFDTTSKIIVNVPDEMRERKCDACRKRFMLKDTFEQHLKECIELKLMKFITDGYQLLSMRKSRTLSASEFVRRTIFSLKKTVKLLALCYKEVSDGQAQILTVGDDKLAKKLNLMDIAGDIEKFHIGPTPKRANNAATNNANNASPSPPMLSLHNGRERGSLNLLEGNPHILVQKNNFNGHSAAAAQPRTSTPQNFSFENKHSSTTISASADSTLTGFKVPKNLRPLRNLPSPSSAAAPANPTRNHRKPADTLQINETVIAQCSPPCSRSFTSLREFEDHVRQDHNASAAKSSDSDAISASSDERNKFMQMLASSSIQF